MPTYQSIAESFDWLDQTSDQPGVVRTADFLQTLQESHGAGPRLALPWRRARTASPGQVQLFQDLRTHLKGHAHLRFVPTDTGWRAGPVASQLVGMLDRYFFNVLEAAKGTATRLAALNAVGYVRHIYMGEDEPGAVSKPVPYSTATQACPAGLSYLDWVLDTACKQKGHRSVALRNRLETEAELWFVEHLGERTLRNELLEDFITTVYEDDSDYFGREEIDRDGLDQAVQKALAQWRPGLQSFGSASKTASGEDIAVKRAFDARPDPNSTAWPWRGMHTGPQASSAGWPFPIRIEVNDRAKPERLRREGKVRRQLSAAFTYTEDYEVHSASQQADEAVRAWQQLEDAGRTLQSLGMALVLLSQGLYPRRRCSVCQRHLGAMGDRTRCELHRADAGTAGTRSGKRTDIYRMDGWGALAQKQWQALLAKVRALPAAMDAARTVRHWWSEPIRISADGNTSNAPQIRLAISTLTARIESLEAWVGKPILDRLLALAGHIEQKLLAATKPTLSFAKDAQDPVGKLMQHELSAQVLFGLHFAGYGTATLPPDRWNPLVQMGAAAYAPNDLLRDLLLQRAWVESGGMQMDMDRKKKSVESKVENSPCASVSPPPSQRIRKINDPGRAIEMKREGQSNVEIAHYFRVSPAAITKFFQRIKKSPLQAKAEATKLTEPP